MLKVPFNPENGFLPKGSGAAPADVGQKTNTDYQQRNSPTLLVESLIDVIVSFVPFNLFNEALTHSCPRLLSHVLVLIPLASSIP